MKQLYEIKYWIFLTGIFLINAGTICKYIYPLSDFMNGVTKGAGMVFLSWFITITCRSSILKQGSNS
jgi:hypothetical protein